MRRYFRLGLFTKCTRKVGFSSGACLTTVSWEHGAWVPNGRLTQALRNVSLSSRQARGLFLCCVSSTKIRNVLVSFSVSSWDILKVSDRFVFVKLYFNLLIMMFIC